MKRSYLFTALIFFNLLITVQASLPYHFPEEPQNNCYKTDAEKCYNLIENQARYLLSLVKPWHGNVAYKLLTDTQGKEEHITRPNTGAVAIFSFLYRFGPYSEKKVGISRQDLLEEYIIPMMRYLITVHKTGTQSFDDGRQWGVSWQSTHWTHQLAQGAATVWDDLPAEIQTGILRIVRTEANEVASKNPPYNLTIDSKSEENAWNAGALSAALMLMPDDEQATIWEKALQHWLLSAYLCPNDAHKDILIDGKTLRSQYEGANIYNDYTLENHGLVHPDYMAACTQKGEMMIDFLATGRQMPDACMYNVDAIYEQLKILLLPSGGFVYPTGQDWGIFRHCDWANLHAFCLYYYNDPEALYWLRVTLDVIARMQKRHIDGRIYAPHENDFPSSQTLCGLGLVDTWKMLMLADPVKEAEPSTQIAKLYPDGKFFIHRTKQSVHTIAWGKKIQFQSMAWSKDPIMAPGWQNGLGFIRLKGHTKSLPLQLQKLEIDTITAAYTFKLQVKHGNAILANYTITSQNDGELIISEKLTATQDVTTEEISTMSFSILNHQSWIEENGYRIIRNGNVENCVKSMFGNQSILSEDQVSVDSRLIISTMHPINGIYIGAKQWKASKLLDQLILNEQHGAKSWKKGETVHENTIRIFYK